MHRRLSAVPEQTLNAAEMRNVPLISQISFPFCLDTSREFYSLLLKYFLNTTTVHSLLMEYKDKSVFTKTCLAGKICAVCGGWAMGVGPLFTLLVSDKIFFESAPSKSPLASPKTSVAVQTLERHQTTLNRMKAHWIDPSNKAWASLNLWQLRIEYF